MKNTNYKKHAVIIIVTFVLSAGIVGVGYNFQTSLLKNKKPAMSLKDFKNRQKNGEEKNVNTEESTEKTEETTKNRDSNTEKNTKENNNEQEKLNKNQIWDHEQNRDGEEEIKQENIVNIQHLDEIHNSYESWKNEYAINNCDYLYCDSASCTCSDSPISTGNGGDSDTPIANGEEPDNFIDEQIDLEPINDELAVLEKKIIFNDEITSGCGHLKANEEYRDHLFNTIKMSIDGKTLYTTEYDGASFFELDDTYMNVKSEDSLDLYGKGYTIAGDCGGGGTAFGYLFANGDYGVNGWHLTRNILFHRNNENMESIAQFVQKRHNSGKIDEIIPQHSGMGVKIGKYNSGQADTEGKYYADFFVGKNKHRYAVVKIYNEYYNSDFDNSASQKKRLLQIYNVDDFNNPIYIKDVEKNSPIFQYIYNGNGKYHIGRNLYSKRGTGTNLPYNIIGIIDGNNVQIYDITNPTNEDLLTTTHDGDILYNYKGKKESGLISDFIRVGDTLYRIKGRYDSSRNKFTDINDVYALEIGKDSDFSIVATFKSNGKWRITQDHVLFVAYNKSERENGQAIKKIGFEAFNLKTGQKIMDEVISSDTYDKVGVRTLRSNALDRIYVNNEMWTITRHGDYYYLYVANYSSVGGPSGPNDIVVLKIGKKGSEEFVDYTCTPNCPDNGTYGVCGAPDGCGGYCMGDDPVCTNRGMECRQLVFKTGSTTLMDHINSYSEIPQCMCVSGKQCNVGETKCEYTERDTYNGLYYTVRSSSCVGSNSCSHWKEDYKNGPTYSSPPSNCEKVDRFSGIATE